MQESFTSQNKLFLVACATCAEQSDDSTKSLDAYFAGKSADFDVRATMWASQNGHIKLVKYLVEKGADFRYDNNYAIRWASENGHLEVVKYLVEKGADFKTDDNYSVRAAFQNGYDEIVTYLVGKGAVLISQVRSS